MEEIATALTVQEFAKQKRVEPEVILWAINNKDIIPIDLNIDDPASCRIHPDYLEKFEIELISLADFAARKRVTVRAVYNRIYRKNQIVYFLDPLSNTMKINWFKYKDIHFRAVQYKYKGKNRLIKK